MTRALTTAHTTLESVDYTLSDDSAVMYDMLSAGVNEMTGTGGPSLGIGPIQIPAYLQRKEMILNRDRDTLSMHEYHRWAEPLKAGISRVVSRISHFKQSLHASEPEQIAAAYSQLLMQLSREIAGAIK